MCTVMISESKQPSISVGGYFVGKLVSIQVNFDVFSILDEAFCDCSFYVACGS